MSAMPNEPLPEEPLTRTEISHLIGYIAQFLPEVSDYVAECLRRAAYSIHRLSQRNAPVTTSEVVEALTVTTGTLMMLLNDQGQLRQNDGELAGAIQAAIEVGNDALAAAPEPEPVAAEAGLTLQEREFAADARRLTALSEAEWNAAHELGQWVESRTADVLAIGHRAVLLSLVLAALHRVTGAPVAETSEPVAWCIETLDADGSVSPLPVVFQTDRKAVNRLLARGYFRATPLYVAAPAPPEPTRIQRECGCEFELLVSDDAVAIDASPCFDHVGSVVLPRIRGAYLVDTAQAQSEEEACNG